MFVKAGNVVYLAIPQDREKNRKEMSSKVEPKTGFVISGNKEINKSKDTIPKLTFFIGVGIGIAFGVGVMLTILNIK